MPGLIRMLVLAALASTTAAAQETPTLVAPPPSPALAAATPAAPGDVSHDLTAADLTIWLDGLMPYALQSGHIAGAVIAVVQNGHVLLSKGYGYADFAARTPMDPAKTLVRAGSTSKLFTWTAIMQLVEAGKLDLDRDVNTYLDFRIDTPPGHPITLRDLMNHRAGFEEGLKGILSIDPSGLESTEAFLKNHPRPLLFPPGSVPAYSNYGASLAGYIVQRVSGEAYNSYVEKHIFQPLGMTHSSFVQPLPASALAHMSKGYHTREDAPQPYELVVTRPAGSLSTTADDMARFMLAQLQQGSLDGATILSPQTAALMQSPSEQPFLPGFATMAHGFFDAVQNGRTVLGHGGDTVLFHTDLELLPKENVGIYVTFNSRGADNAVYGARQALFDNFMDRYFPAPHTTEPPTFGSALADAGRMAGLYESSRRIAHGFLAVLSLFQQTEIVANPDGTITAPDMLGTGRTLHEIAPLVWKDVHGEGKIALTMVNGVKTIVDSQDPSDVLQAVPFIRSATLNLPVFVASVTVLVWAVILWALSPLLRTGDRGALVLSRQAARIRLVLRMAAAFDILWLLGWFFVISPVLSSQVQLYNDKLDPAILALELCGFLAAAALAFCLWSARALFGSDLSWLSRLWSVLVLAGLAGIIWIGVAGKLIAINVNY